MTASRRYDSTLRRERAAETRERIVTAGCELLEASSIRDWRAVTMRAVAERAGVNERTVYRHVGSERGLRDEVMRRLEQQAGIDLEGLTLDGVATVTGQIFAVVASHPLEPRMPMDPTLSDAGARQREALRRVVADRAKGWSEEDQVAAAAMLDALWGVATYERLAVDWELDQEEAVAAITWVMGLIEDAVRTGSAPSGGVPSLRA